MLILDVLDDDVRQTFIGLVHEPTVDDRSRRVAVAAAAGGQVMRG